MTKNKEITRCKAIRLLCQYELYKLSKPERESILMDYWYHDEDDLEYFILSDELKFEVKNLDPPQNAENNKYNVLILECLISGYRGVLNSYIKTKLNNIGAENLKIIGQEEDLVKCLCCGYKTLDYKGNYDICNVCFWEDDGTLEPDIYSGANRKTLNEAKKYFTKNKINNNFLNMYNT